MRYQELLFSTSVLGAAIASHNCRHPGNMRFGPVDFPGGNSATIERTHSPQGSGSRRRNHLRKLVPNTDYLPRLQIRTLLDAVGTSHLCQFRTYHRRRTINLRGTRVTIAPRDVLSSDEGGRNLH